MSNVGQQLKEYFKNQGITQKELAERFNVDKAYINALFTGRSMFGKRQAERWSKEFGLSQSWLLTGEGDMFNTTLSSYNNHPIPYFLDVDVSLGDVTFMDAPPEQNYLINIPGFNDCDFAINAWGNSMYPLIKNGQIILLSAWNENFVEWGCIYLIVTKNGKKTIKRLFPSAKEGCVSCQSEDAAHFPPFDVETSYILHLYMVKGWINRESL